VLKWIEEEMGGLEKMEAYNKEKAGLLYDFMEASNFYRPTARQDSRSLMNVTFRLPSEELEQKFIKEATSKGLGGLKGHRSVGGCRASIYNAATMAGIKALVEFMDAFQKEAK
jgi:phosphoserine aminotransferase